MLSQKTKAHRKFRVTCNQVLWVAGIGLVVIIQITCRNLVKEVSGKRVDFLEEIIGRSQHFASVIINPYSCCTK